VKTCASTVFAEFKTGKPRKTSPDYRHKTKSITPAEKQSMLSINHLRSSSTRLARQPWGSRFCARFGRSRAAAITRGRRNVITRGLDLVALYDIEFELQGVRFRGMGECKPCHWMDHAFGPGAEDALQGRGGLRAKIVIGGKLRVAAAGLTGLVETAKPFRPARI
jgi:hypothetical protein